MSNPHDELLPEASAGEVRKNLPRFVVDCRAGDVVELEHAGALIRVVILTARQWGDRFVRPISQDGKNLAEPFTADGRAPVTFIAEHYRW